MKKLTIGIAAALAFACLTGAAFTTPSQIWVTANNGLLRLLSDKLMEDCSVGDFAGSGSTQMSTANTNCRHIHFPAGTYSFSTAISMPASFGRIWRGDGQQATTLTYTGTGPCGVIVDGSQAGGFENMTISVTNTGGATAPVCFTDTTGSAQRWHFIDVRLVGAQGNPPISGAYCLYMHSTTGSGIAYNWGTGLTTLNCQRGVEMLGDSGSGGVNGNWFMGYSANATVNGVYFDNAAGDNYVQGHCNASGTTYAQTCAVIGDGTHTSSGNEIHLVGDNGPLGSVYNCQNHAVNSFIFAIKESGALGTNTIACDSTNHIFSSSTDGVAARNDFLPSANVGGVFGVGAGAIFSSSLTASRYSASTSAGGGSVALTSGTPSTATVSTFTGARCVCTNTTTQANPVKCAVSSATLTITGPNSVTDTIAYFCF